MAIDFQQLLREKGLTRSYEDLRASLLGEKAPITYPSSQLADVKQPPPAPAGFDPAAYAKKKGYKSYFQKNGQWYANKDGTWIPVKDKAQARVVSGVAETGMPGGKEPEEPEEPTDYWAEAEEFHKPWLKRETEEIESEAQRLEKRAMEDYEVLLKDLEAEKKKLLTDYQNYLQDIETGKIRAGTDQQRELARMLDEKRMWIEEQEARTKTNLDAIHRHWMGRGAIFAGPRFEAAGEYQATEARAGERYEAGYEYGKESVDIAYQRAMEDYATKQERAGETYQMGEEALQRKEDVYGTAKERTVEDIGLQRIQKTREAQEEYAGLVTERAGLTPTLDWRKRIYGY